MLSGELSPQVGVVSAVTSSGPFLCTFLWKMLGPVGDSSPARQGLHREESAWLRRRHQGHISGSHAVASSHGTQKSWGL